MFEHLTPTIDTKTKNKIVNLRIYLPIFLAAAFIFVIALSVGKGPAGLAQGEKLSKLTASVSIDPSDKKIVFGAQEVSVFDWVINVEQKDINLKNIRVYINGLYAPQLIEDLLLYHNNSPVPIEKKLDSQGNVYFELADYILTPGQNHFSLFLADTDNLIVGDVFSFVLSDVSSLSLSYNDHNFVAQGVWPLQGGLVTIVDKGQILAFSNSADREFLIASDLPQRVASFSLITDSEMVDVNKIDISVDNTNAEGEKFVLISDKKLLAEAQVHDGRLLFNLNKPVALSIKNRGNIELHAFALPTGSYQFDLDKASGLGFSSGRVVDLFQSIKLSQLEATGFFPEFSNGQFKTRLITGPNELYDLKVRSRGRNELKIYKLTWLLERQNVELGKAEIRVDNEIYIADVNILDDKIIVKANWSKPIMVKNTGTNIKLILDAIAVGDKASIKTYLLPDQTELSDQGQANILWAAEEKLYNSYQLPFLPLAPNILNN